MSTWTCICEVVYESCGCVYVEVYVYVNMSKWSYE